jgi:DNA-binding NarL/FixJ family response regulator
MGLSETSRLGARDTGSSGRMITVAIVEDNRLVREGIAGLLNALPDIRVIAAESSATTAVLGKVAPEIVLLDLGLRNGDSLTVARKLKAGLPESKVIVMDLLPVQEDIVDFVNAGVSGFIMKDATVDDLANTIRAVSGGAHILPPQMTGTLFSQIAREVAGRPRPEAQESVRMTPREREVINLIAEGLGNKEIAGRLHIATHTVKSHVRNIMEKLALHTRLQIAAYAHKDSTA